MPLNSRNETNSRWFLTERHQRYQIDDVESLVDNVDDLEPIFAEDGYRFQTI